MSQEISKGQAFRNWWKGTKPTDLLSVIMSLLSVAIAFWALYKANQVSNQQEEAAAPVLAPGTSLAERGARLVVYTDYAKVIKRADRLYLDRGAGRVVIPIRNGGSGIALTIGRPVVVSDCAEEPNELPDSAVAPPLGAYVISSGDSDQLGFVQPAAGAKKRYVSNQAWYSFNYRDFGTHTAAGTFGNLLIWYTDGAQRRLRWTCDTYQSSPDGYGDEWVSYATQYGTRDMVTIQPNTR